MTDTYPVRPIAVEEDPAFTAVPREAFLDPWPPEALLRAGAGLAEAAIPTLRAVQPAQARDKLAQVSSQSFSTSRGWPWPLNVTFNR